jgi:RNA polymerase sigma factor for flagellar operon FliA
MKTSHNSVVKKTRKVSEANYNKALKKYSILIRSLARKLSSGSPAGLDYDDLCSSGRIGLLKAMEKYDPEQKKQFSAYVKYRIRGTMLDEIRSHDWVPRSVKEKAKMVRVATEELRAALDREPTNVEVAKRLGLKGEHAYKLTNSSKKCTLISTEDIKNYSQKERTSMIETISSSNPLQSPSTTYIEKDTRKNLLKLLHNLKTNERVIISLYYFEDLSYKEIGKVLDLTESRISQLHTQAIKKLQSDFGDEIKELLN